MVAGQPVNRALRSGKPTGGEHWSPSGIGFALQSRLQLNELYLYAPISCHRADSVQQYRIQIRIQRKPQNFRAGFARVSVKAEDRASEVRASESPENESHEDDWENYSDSNNTRKLTSSLRLPGVNQWR
jgi:hypothetical protein